MVDDSLQKQAHKETLNKHKLMLLQEAASHVMKTLKNEFPLHELSGNINSYNNFQKLRYSGLIFKVKRGTWGITRNGWAFLRGEIALPKYVLVRDNHIITKSNNLVYLKDIYYGADYIQTVFEYFNEYGEPVGLRPAPVSADMQLGML